MKKLVMETIYNSSSGFIYFFSIYNLLGVRYSSCQYTEILYILQSEEADII